MQTKEIDDQIAELERIIIRAAELMDEIGSIHIGVHQATRSITINIEDDDEDETFLDADLGGFMPPN